ncbi:MAG: M20/M25/M40 family metallo-hydrolase [Chloroflexota bacterium]
MTFNLKDHLRTLVELHAPSGHEGAARAAVREAWADLVDEFQQDGLGSLIGIKRANAPTNPPRKIMLAAHIDEIGMMVRDVVDGFVFIYRISGVDNRVMPAQTVMVHGREMLPGIVATTPPHLLSADDRRKYPNWDHMVVDVGLPHDEVVKLVRPGDVVTVDAPMIELAGNKIAAKAMDDRACVAAVTQCLVNLQGMQHSWDVYATATVQEENGGYNGAVASSYMIEPDVAVALDVTFAPQAGVSGDDTSEIGGGPTLSIGPNFHGKLRGAIKQAAAALEMPMQDDVLSGRSGTDAWAIQVSRQGVPTALLSVPLRNMHSPVETADIRDIERTGRLLAHFIAGLDADFLAAIDFTVNTATE